MMPKIYKYALKVQALYAKIAKEEFMLSLVDKSKNKELHAEIMDKIEDLSMQITKLKQLINK
ncbi:hypothetical protein HGB13_00090 [bacterium]|nr:hypothetical protein [bacterium]